MASRSWPGEMWLHERNKVGYTILWKMNDGTIVGGQPANWNAAYNWIGGSYGAFVTGATNSTLTRSGSGTTESPYTLGLNLSNANTWKATQTDTAGFVTKYATGNDAISGAVLTANFGSRPAGWMGTYYDSNLDKMYFVTRNEYSWFWIDMTKE